MGLPKERVRQRREVFLQLMIQNVEDEDVRAAIIDAANDYCLAYGRYIHAWAKSGGKYK